MNTSSVKIPDKFWKLILAFLEAKKDGQLILHANSGNILKLEIQESVRL